MEAIRSVGAMGTRRSAGDVAPAISVEGAGRMEDDSNSSGTKQQERGLEDEDADLGEPQVENPGSVDVMA